MTSAELKALAVKDSLVAAIVRQRETDVTDWIAAGRRRWKWFFGRGFTVTPR